MSTEKTNQSWGGRFSEPVDAFVARFTASVEFDKRLYRHDIMGSIAHATMLAKVGVLSDAERDSIIDGLKQIQTEIEAGQFDWRGGLEDGHLAKRPGGHRYPPVAARRDRPDPRRNPPPAAGPAGAGRA